MAHLCLQFGICNGFPLTTLELAVGALQTTAPLQFCPVFPIYPPKDATHPKMLPQAN